MSCTGMLIMAYKYFGNTGISSARYFIDI